MNYLQLANLSTLLTLSAGLAYADIITMSPNNNDRLYVGSTQNIDKPWADGNELYIAPLQTANVFVDGTIAPTKINFLESYNHVALRTGNAAKIDWGGNMALIESSNIGIAYIDAPMYGTGGLTVINNRPLSYTGGSTGTLLIQTDNSNLTGGITVEKGFLSVAHEKALGNNDVTLKNNSGIALTMAWFDDKTIANNFIIDGEGGFRSQDGWVNQGGVNVQIGIKGTFSGVVSGQGTLSIGNNITLGGIFFTGENTFTGNVNIAYGRMSIGNGGESGSFDNVSSYTLANANSILSLNRANDFEIAANISGSGTVEKLGAGTATLSGENTFTGGVNINAGSLAVADAAKLGTGAIAIDGGDLRFTNDTSSNHQMLFSNSASISVDSSKTATLTGVLSGDTLTKKGAGTLNVQNFSNLNTLDAQAGTLNAVVSSNANIGNINASGVFEKTGAGTLNVTKTGTILSGGELKISEGAFNVASGANLSAFGKITGTVGVLGSFASNAGSTVENAVFKDGSTLHANGGNFETITFGESSADKISVDFLSNSTTVSNILTNAADVYFDFTNLGNLDQSGGKMYLFTGFDASGFDFSNYSVSFSHDGSGLGSDTSGIYFSWSAYTPLTAIWTGSLSNVWDVNTTANWKDSASQASAKFNQWDGVIFNDGAANTDVLISERITPAELEVDASTNSYTFSGEGEISGTTSLVKKGSSTLSIENANSYEGGTQIEGGTISVKNMNALGIGKITTTGDALLRFDASGTFGTQIVLDNAEALNVEVADSNTVVFESANMANGSTFSKSGSGLLKIQGENALAGTFNLNGGDAEFTAISGPINGTFNVANDAALKMTGAFETALNGTVNLNGGTLEVSAAGTNTIGFNFNGTLSGSGNVSFESTDSYVGHFGSNSKIALDKNSIIDIKNNTFYMNAGADFSDNYSTLNIAKDARFDFYQNNRAEFGGLTGLGTITASQENTNIGYPGNTLVIGKGTSAGDVYTFGGTISGGTPFKNYAQDANSIWAAYTEINLVKTGYGTQIITGDNFAAVTTIDGGTLQFGDGSTDGRPFGAKIENNGTLVMNNKNAQEFVGTISGTGDFVKEGAGTLTLNGKNTYTGKTIIKEGTLKLDSSSIKTPITIMAYGDSITAGAGGSYGGYRGFLADLLINSGNQSTATYVGTEVDGGLPAGYRNHAGIGGDFITYQIEGGQYHESRFEPRIALKPDVILLHMGVNDLNHQIEPLEVFNATLEFIREVKASSPNTDILLATIVPSFSQYSPSPNIDYFYSNIEEFNGYVKAFCQDPSKYGAEFADMNINLVDLSLEGGYPILDKYTMGDSLHPNNSGYSYMASRWYSALMKYYGADETAALSSASAIEISQGATLDVNNKIAVAKSLSGAGNVALGTGALVVAPETGTMAEFSGIISGAGDFVKDGEGTQILSGANTHTGITAINSGTLRVNGSLQSSEILVADGATLDGSGNINSSVQINGKLAIGGEHGALEFSKDLTLDGESAVFEINIGEDGLSDFIVFLGDAQFSMSNTVKVNVLNADTSSYNGKVYRIFDGANATGSLFDAEGLYKFSSNSIDYVLSNTGLLAIGSSIPEPGTYATILGALALWFAAYRKRK